MGSEYLTKINIEQIEDSIKVKLDELDPAQREILLQMEYALLDKNLERGLRRHL